MFPEQPATWSRSHEEEGTRPHEGTFSRRNDEVLDFDEQQALAPAPEAGGGAPVPSTVPQPAPVGAPQ